MGTKENSSKPTSNEENNTSVMARKAASGTLATVVMRLVSFVCTQYTLRVLDPSTLGRALVQLDLLLTTILFVSREGFRLALTRHTTSRDGANDAKSWNVAWCSIPVVTLVSGLAFLGWHRHATNTDMDPDFYRAGVLYCVACCIEGWAEPAVLWALRNLNVATKASAEGLATVGKTITTVLVLQYWQNTWPVTAFGIAQLAYAVIYATFLYYEVGSDLVWPKWSVSSMDGKASRFVVIFTLQGLFKHVLTEGDRIVLTTLSGTYDQGVYAMGSAYGGMAARLILQPLEENARLLWSRLSIPNPTLAQLNHLKESYVLLVKLVMYIGLVFSCLAVNYTSVVLNLLAGRKWGDNPEATRVLTAFCVYTAFLAGNGMTEAFVYAVASSGADLGRLGLAHTVVGLVFAGVASVAVARYGAVGLVAANCIAMFCRSLYSIYYAARYFSQRNQSTTTTTTTTTVTSLWSAVRDLVPSMFPNPVVLVAFAVTYTVTYWSKNQMQEQLHELAKSSAWIALAARHVAVGATCGVGIVTLAYLSEVEFLRSFRTMWSGDLKTKHE